MAVATITLDSPAVDDWVVVSAPNDEFLADDIILDTGPEGMYDTGFTVRTQSGAFEPGGRIVGEQVPIREMVLPFHLTPASRPRFQRLWGTPGNFHKVRYTYDGPSGPRSLTLKLSKEIKYTTEDGFDADIDDSYHAVVSAIAVNPMFEAGEDVSEWTNPDDRFSMAIVAAGGTFPLTFTPRTGPPATTTLPWNVSVAALKSALEAIVGVGNVGVAGTPATSSTTGTYSIVFAVGTNGVLTGSTTGLTGTGLFGATKSVTIDYAPNTGWFDVWNPTDQPLWLEWEFDPAQSWQFPDWAFGQERKWNRPVGADAARMIVSQRLTQLLSVMSDPFMDTYVNADLSNAAGLFNGVEPVYMVPPYTGTDDNPVLMPVVCRGPAGAKATLRQRRFWSAESGLEQP
jgi:hypothetical protein